MSDETVIVMTGNPVEGFEAHGPFSDRWVAIHWVAIQMATENTEKFEADWWIMPLQSMSEEAQ